MISQIIKSTVGSQIEKAGVNLRVSPKSSGTRRLGMVIEETGKIIAGKEKELEKNQY